MLSERVGTVQEMYLKRKSFAFNSDRPGVGGEEARQVFEKSMSTVDMTFQNLDSSEISLTDVSHYFDSDPTNLVQGLRKDGRKPNSYVADTTTANAQVRFPPPLRARAVPRCLCEPCNLRRCFHTRVVDQPLSAML